MHTTTLKIGPTRTIPLTIAPGTDAIDLDEVKAFPPFKEWVAALGKEMDESEVAERVDVRGVVITSVDRFKNNNLGFLKFTANVQWTDSPRTTLPGIIFSRGPSVAILLLLYPPPPHPPHALLTLQPRLAIPSLAFLELPAGMLDGSNQFTGVAARELEEECGITVGESDLVDLVGLANGGEGGGVVYPSPGGCDESVRLFLCRKEVGVEELRRLEGRRGGLREEGERIELRVVPVGELWRATRDMKALAALALWERCVREGLVVG
ncbi:NUDIX hydrolase domain-like protein [Blyttiomyces helicus]|uniref:NUDIX hydrolase domain-like protein n=1 Tax=Blyttiomyces helicus TaxID=388810 RepID=A0A4P9W086_9FUNG|nr:NUDIX hydrolase domain-like protein [Blyttiomyces helicus]|eukprot:RKO85042.1 NUDIX hydrolase domain-like protein [Blyttiomyces helicus]